jgi:hypothetical protein
MSETTGRRIETIGSEQAYLDAVDALSSTAESQLDWGEIPEAIIPTFHDAFVDDELIRVDTRFFTVPCASTPEGPGGIHGGLDDVPSEVMSMRLSRMKGEREPFTAYMMYLGALGRLISWRSPSSPVLVEQRDRRQVFTGVLPLLGVQTITNIVDSGALYPYDPRTQRVVHGQLVPTPLPRRLVGKMIPRLLED